MFTMQNERPFMDGDLISHELDLRDFTGYIGASPKPDAPPRLRLLPDQPYDLEGLRVADADIRFPSDNIVNPTAEVPGERNAFMAELAEAPHASRSGEAAAG